MSHFARSLHPASSLSTDQKTVKAQKRGSCKYAGSPQAEMKGLKTADDGGSSAFIAGTPVLFPKQRSRESKGSE
jgi:hypothetical protein